MNGIDAYAATVEDAKSAKADFVIAYLGGVPGKTLTKERALEYIQAGLHIVCVFETAADRAKDGQEAGIADARTAVVEMKAVGAPPFRPVYFAVDIDTSPNPSEILPYFTGIHSVLGTRVAGAYGGIDTMNVLFEHGLIGWGYQTEAWSHGQWHPKAQLRQVGYGKVYDTDQAVAGDYGGWK